MTISDKLDILIDSMDDSNAATIAAIESTRPSAEVVSTAPLLGGKTPAVVINEVLAPYNLHANNYSNPHLVVPSQLGTLTQNEIEIEVNKYLPLDASGIDRFGMNSHLEPNITGAFKGNNNWTYFPPVTIMENNGNLIILRNGSDGFERGVYYSYVQNALGATMPPMTHTTKRYLPSCLPSNRIPYMIVATGEGCFLIQLATDLGVVTSEYALIFHNDSGDSKVHQYGMLNADQHAELNSSHWTTKHSPSIKLFLDKTTNIVYMVFTVVTDGFNYGAIRIFKHNSGNPAADRNGGLITFAPITAGGTQLQYARPFGDVYTSTASDVKLFNALIAPSASALASRALLSAINETPSLSHHITTGSPPFTFMVKDNKLRFLGYCGILMSSTSVPTATIRPYVEIGLEINLATNVVTHTSTQNYPIPVNIDGTTFLFNNVSYAPGLSQAAPVTAMPVINYNHALLIKRGAIFDHSFTNSASFNGGRRVMRRLIVGGFSDFDAMLPINAQAQNAGWLGVVSPTPTPGVITSTIKVAGFVPDGMVVICPDINNVVKPYLVKTDLDTIESGYQDPVVGAVIGYPQTNDRSALADATVTRIVNHVTATGTLGSFGTRFGRLLPVTRKRDFDGNAVPTGADITVPDSLQQSFTSAVMASLVPSVWTNPLYTTHHYEFVFNPLLPKCSIAYIFSVNPSESKVTVSFFVFNATFTGDTWTAYNNVVLLNSTENTNLTLLVGTPYTTDGGTVVDGSVAPTCYMERSTLGTYRVVVSSLTCPRNVSNTHSTFWFDFTWNDTTAVASSVSRGSTRVLYSVEATTHRLIAPNVGVGTWVNMMDGSAAGMAVLEVAPNANPAVTVSSRFILAQQKLKEGWLVYFTTPISVIMNGRKGFTTPEIIDLKVINPFLTPGDTFYVYLEDTGTEFVFRVRVAKNMVVGHTVMRVGKILTDANGVSEIQIGNITRLANYNLSTVADSESIAVSGGNPAEAAMLLWS